MGGSKKSWGETPSSAKALIVLVLLAGSCVLLYGAIHPSSKNTIQFTCYLLISLLVSQLKVSLPEVADTMSVNFLFTLLGILELSFTETLVLGCVAARRS